MVIARATATSRYDFDPREEFIVANVGTGASTLKERLAVTTACGSSRTHDFFSRRTGVVELFLETLCGPWTSAR